MASVISRLAKQPPKTFKVSYAPHHKTFHLQHIATDHHHPLHEAQKRRQIARQKEGLWWHATTGADLNKSSCVRSWARRRLRQAFTDELRQRGYDETGHLVHLDAIQGGPDPGSLLQQGQTLTLTGSLRLHIQPPLISAKYAEVRSEVGSVLEILLQALTIGPSRDRGRAANRQSFVIGPRVHTRS